jgi:hypothetical protein
MCSFYTMPVLKEIVPEDFIFEKIKQKVEIKKKFTMSGTGTNINEQQSIKENNLNKVYL